MILIDFKNMVKARKIIITSFKNYQNRLIVGFTYTDMKSRLKSLTGFISTIYCKRYKLEVVLNKHIFFSK